MEGETHSVPWMSFSAVAAFFIAAIVSALKLADSSVFTCISSWNRVPCRRSSSCSVAFLRFSAAVAAAHAQGTFSALVQRGYTRVRGRGADGPALFETAFALAFLSSSSIFFCRYSSFFSTICSCCRSVTIASREDCLASRRPPK